MVADLWRQAEKYINSFLTNLVVLLLNYSNLFLIPLRTVCNFILLRRKKISRRDIVETSRRTAIKQRVYFFSVEDLIFVFNPGINS
jgi:hypothetical protein